MVKFHRNLQSAETTQQNITRPEMNPLVLIRGALLYPAPTPALSKWPVTTTRRNVGVRVGVEKHRSLFIVPCCLCLLLLTRDRKPIAITLIDHNACNYGVNMVAAVERYCDMNEHLYNRSGCLNTRREKCFFNRLFIFFSLNGECQTGIEGNEITHGISFFFI